MMVNPQVAGIKENVICGIQTSTHDNQYISTEDQLHNTYFSSISTYWMLLAMASEPHIISLLAPAVHRFESQTHASKRRILSIK
jgi:hypothetical protein